MTRIICVASGKGGAGKTTIVANLGLALAELGKDVTILDANLTTPNLGIHLGVPLYPTTLHDVLKGKANIKDAVYEHESGLKIIPAGLSLNDLRGIDSRDLPNALLDLLGHSEIIIVDASAGLGREALSAIESSDEMILVTNPDLPSVTDALKAAKLAEQMGTRITGLAINRKKNKSHEMSSIEIQKMLDGIEILAEIPEDEGVQKSLSKRNPVVHHMPNSPASREIKRLAYHIAGYKYTQKYPWHKKMFSMFSRR